MTVARRARRDWAIALAGLGVAAALLAFGRGSRAPRTERISLAITVVPSDAASLNCRGSFDLGGLSCAFDGRGQPTRAAFPLRPYMTVDRQMLLLSGVFEEPHVRGWLTQSTATGSGTRVILDCSATVMGVVPQVEVQWAPQTPWGPEREATVARVESCRLR